MRRLSLPFAIAILAAFACPRSGVAAAVTAVQPGHIPQAVVQAWLGVATLLADDDRDDDDRVDDDRDDDKRRRHEGRGQAHRGDGERSGHHGRAHGDGSGGPAAMLREIMARLGRIEAKLDARSGWQGRGPGGPPRPPMSEEMRRGMSERMREAGPPSGRGPRPEMPESMRRMMEERMRMGREQMEEARKRMEDARRRFKEMEDRIRRLEQEVERLKRAD